MYRQWSYRRSKLLYCFQAIAAQVPFSISFLLTLLTPVIRPSYYRMSLSDVVVTLSGFERDVKDGLASLTSVLGSQYSTILKVKATTHLICASPSGPKFEKAKELGSIK